MSLKRVMPKYLWEEKPETKRLITTDDSFSPLFETAARRTNRGGVCRTWDPVKAGRQLLAGHSRALILSDRPPSLSIDSNNQQHTTQAEINGQLTF